MPIGGGGLLRLKKLLAISSGGAGKAAKLKYVDFKIQTLVSQKTIYIYMYQKKDTRFLGPNHFFFVLFNLVISNPWITLSFSWSTQVLDFEM